MVEKKADWIDSVAAMREALKLWYEKHPEATLDEIVAQVTGRRREIMGELVQELIDEAKGKPRLAQCPECGGELEYRGKQSRYVIHYEGETEIRRSYYYCPQCKRGFSPLDEKLGLVSHRWSPEMIGYALQLGAEIPSFRRAAKAFDTGTKISLSKSTLQKLMVEYGSGIEQAAAREAERLNRPDAAAWIEQEQPEPDAETMAVSMDGVMVHIREEGWKEVKIAAFSAVEQKTTGDQAEVHLTQHSYCAGLWEVKEFAKRQWAEAWRRGLEKAQQVVSVNDGAVWIWSLVRTCYAPCIQIIDWWHAVEHLWEIVHAMLGEENSEAKRWAETLKELLWNGQVREVISQVRVRCPAQEDLSETLRRMLRYFIRYRHQMHYADYRAKGYPIGSGTVESACKTVVQERICQAGMSWSRTGIQAMLNLRCALLSNRWHEALASQLHARAAP